ncbi:MAG: ribonuclease E/G [Candidatus Pelagibacter sp.]|nr:ribonuclease E/G [Candidatus Pelagibacter sp.]OUV98265.1 MAG: ribonuclease E/G [Candidatus Pelagibacter sp. TMED142]
MEKRILIDASHKKQTRVAITSDKRVDGYEFEDINKKQLKGNIYLGRISRIEPSLQAAFVDFGNERHGFLAFNDIQTEYYQIPKGDKEEIIKIEEEVRKELKETQDIEINNNQINEDIVSDKNDVEKKDQFDENDNNEIDINKKVEDIRNKKKFKRYRIQEVIKPNQVILVQIVKEERGKKGAALTTFLSLAGKYIVLMPNTAKGGGISRKIFNSQDRKHIRNVINDLDLPSTMGLIVRTAGAKKTKNEISSDLNVLLSIWNEITNKTLESNAPTLIHEEGDLIYRTIRDFFNLEIDNIIIEGENGFKIAKKYCSIIAKDQIKKIKKYKSKTPLFHFFEIEKYLNNIFEPRVELKSGGYMIISPTEALVAIDINSGKATKERNVEKTALATNLEAADEIARQIKLRDLAGLIVVDFIDMENFSNRRFVERKMKEALRGDKARTQVGRISNFGLLEMTRQRLRESSVKWQNVLSKDSFSEKILRLIEQKYFDFVKIKKINVKVCEAIKNYIDTVLKNNLKYIEKKYKLKIATVKDNKLLSNEFVINLLNAKNKEIGNITEINVENETETDLNFKKNFSNNAKVKNYSKKLKNKKKDKNSFKKKVA